MTRTVRYVLFVPLICINLACSSRGKSDSSAEMIEPKFSSIQQQIFNGSCTAPSCHGSGRKGSLSLDAGESYRELVGVVSEDDKKGVPPFLRVEPGKPNSSFLYIKITKVDSGQGEIMPKGNDRLRQNQIDAIRQWIANGALDD